MIVTASTLLGLTSLNGSFELHLAMLIILFWDVDLLTLPNMPALGNKDEEGNHSMESGTLVLLCRIVHGYLFLISFFNQSPKFSNNIMLAVANFAGLAFYCFVISKVSIELYDSQPLAWMESEETIVG